MFKNHIKSPYTWLYIEDTKKIQVAFFIMGLGKPSTYRCVHEEKKVLLNYPIPVFHSVMARPET